jgi:hypothetical protein
VQHPRKSPLYLLSLSPSRLANVDNYQRRLLFHRWCSYAPRRVSGMGHGEHLSFVVFASFGKSITPPSNLHFKDRQSRFSLVAGGWWLAYAATIHPFFNAFSAYSPDHSNPTDGLTTRSFNASFGFFMVFMSVLCFLYLICSLHTNIVFATIFACPFTGFILLTGTFWYAADGNSALAGRMVFMVGLVTFFADLADRYNRFR